MRNLAILPLLAFTAACFGAPPTTVSGRVSVTDGDSFEIGEERIRLNAVDAPEGRQTCVRGGEIWKCGEAAADKMRALVAGRTVTCTKKDEDSYGRVVAVCSNGSVDLGAEMVSAGLALAYRQYGNDYVDEETTARAARKGLWGSEFTRPAEFRAQQRGGSSSSGRSTPTERPAQAPRSTDPAPRGGSCAVKGNVSYEGERIYHVPGSPSYDETRIDASRGERMFCSVQEAEAAGWRAPRQRRSPR